METHLPLFVAVIALELGVLIVALAYALVRLQRTIKAVEILAYRVEERVDDVGSMLKSSWLRGAGTLLAGFLGGRSRRS